MLYEEIEESFFEKKIINTVKDKNILWILLFAFISIILAGYVVIGNLKKK